MGSASSGTGQPVLRRDAVRNIERISTAAMDAFAELGLDVSMADVANRAGVGVGTVYRRFGDKNGLVTALFESKVEEVVLLAEEARAGNDPVESLLALLVGVNELMAANKGLRQLILAGGLEATEVSDRALDRLVPVVETLVDDAKRTGWLRESLSATDFPVMLIAVQSVRDVGASAHPELWRRVLRMLIDGIRADSREAVEIAAPGPLADPESRSLLERGRR